MILDLTLFTDSHYIPTQDAQNNLNSRTYYVHSDTLKYHKARVLETYIVDQGRLFALLESFEYHDGTRRRRFVIFDICGTVVGERSPEGWSTTKQARAAMWAELDTLDAEALAAAAVTRARRYLESSLDYLRRQTAGI